ncbi:serine phosphatase RsbU (regulator of sigma subunit) [Spinactinospora alkalitolerans]|uniref:Serine phosphatase RsbU (Regulator of sigma subunit) n=1 Tax=Spinactinospora alkalitolerans TaxID=687207 RepID=A0A852U3E7_9ACTN|nr:GAF domain-containing SpoIIE family protein phosphatase [Spinactinospora alkalitolerans]NYE50748.1 serine phosphatase RsbU (regulator of sigma subunit) [Spinactinospora alkalitolerans]
MQSRSERMLGGLLQGSHLASLEDLPTLVAEHAALVGFSETMIYVVDLQQQSLLPLPGQYDASGRTLEPIRIDTTMAGWAFRNVDVARAWHTAASSATVFSAPSAEREPRRLWIPLLDGTERLGVLGITVPDLDETSQQWANQLASLVSLLMVSKRDTSDAYALLVRADRMTVPAEVLWNLMPSTTLANDRIVISAVLEPAYNVGGDAYDYALNGDVLHLSVFDAMGHDLAAGLTASTAMGASRSSRRQGKDLVTIGEVIDEAVAEQFDPPRFTTGVLATLDTRTGLLTWINRGHHPPLVLRRGRQVATLDSPSSPPMGIGLGLSAEPARYQLEPGDRLLFFTDGVTEARSPDGELFGLERFTDFIIRREADGLSAPETLRRLMQTILEHQEGRLQDDATVLLVEWATQRHRQLTP